LDLVILLAEHDEPTLAAKKKRQLAPLKLATSTPKNRVWGFENIPSGRPCVEFDLTWETAIGSVQYTYRNASGRAEWLSRDPLGENGGLNLYGYVLNNPIWAIDPFGLETYFTHYTGLDDDYRQAALIEASSVLAGALTVITLDPEDSITAAQNFAGLNGNSSSGGNSGSNCPNGGNPPPSMAGLKGQRGWGSNLPTTGGPPNGSLSAGQGDNGTIRDYDSNGNAKTDYDFGHDHGAGDPHAHDWSNGTRGAGRGFFPWE
jgi:RHS repeat-associated protein